MKHDMTEEYLRPAVKESDSLDERVADWMRRFSAFLKAQNEDSNEFREALSALRAERRE